MKSITTGTLSTFRPLTTAEITKIIMNSPAKHCCLNPATTWLVKQLCYLLAPSIAEMCNASFVQGILPKNQKHAVVRPRLKKSSLKPDDMNSYRPISNLSFISKTIERVVAVRFSEHADCTSCYPSANRPIVHTIPLRRQSQPSTIIWCTTSIKQVK